MVPFLVEEDVPALMILLEDLQKHVGGFESNAWKARRAQKGRWGGHGKQRIERVDSGFRDARHGFECCLWYGFYGKSGNGMLA